MIEQETRMIWQTCWWLEDLHEEEEEEREGERERLRDHSVGMMGFTGDNLKGFLLALLSSAFIGASFVIKKKGLRRAAATSGVRAGNNLNHCVFSSLCVCVLGILHYIIFLLPIFFFFCEFNRCWWVFISHGTSMVAWNDHQ